MNKLALNIFSAVVLSLAAQSANAMAYIFTDLGDLVGGGAGGSKATGINDAGQVVGFSSYDNGSQHAIIWNGAIATELAPLSGSVNTVASSINNSGQVAGWSSGHATLWNGSTVTDLGSGTANALNDSGQVVGLTPSTINTGVNSTIWNGTTITNLGQSTSIRGVNNAGQVVGSSSYGAALWNGITRTNLGTLGGSTSEAYDINNASQAVGWSYSSPGMVEGVYIGSMVPHATLWNGTAITDLGTLAGANNTKAGAGSYSMAFAINDAGIAVGRSEIASFGYRAALWSGTTVTDLNSFLDASAVNAGWVLNEATGINGNGWVVGNATNNLLGVSHAFMLAPIPEPETYSMLISGLVLLGFMVRRRKLKQDI